MRLSEEPFDRSGQRRRADLSAFHRGEHHAVPQLDLRKIGALNPLDALDPLPGHELPCVQGGSRVGTGGDEHHHAARVERRMPVGVPDPRQGIVLGTVQATLVDPDPGEVALEGRRKTGIADPPAVQQHRRVVSKPGELRHQRRHPGGGADHGQLLEILPDRGGAHACAKAFRHRVDVVRQHRHALVADVGRIFGNALDEPLRQPPGGQALDGGALRASLGRGLRLA
ncbi:hypothetical protein ACFPYM_05355 [Methylobacterium hispanicum]|uniref:hypothetical protein n=1 Tax=Methylobacterium hispanicum TaxID=270350 RepID=UPI001EDFFA5C|nr:hypothetical protein [Methylobacterium hispanicum]